MTKLHVVFIYVFIFSSLCVYKDANAQETGGPYTPDANTVLLMHFDDNLNEEASNYTVNNHGIAKSYITSPVSGLNDAIYFDNSNTANQSFISIPYSAELSLSNNWTIEFWFRINSWDESHNLWPIPIVLSAPDWETNYFLEMPAADGTLKFSFHTSEGVVSISSSQNSITTGTWYHVVLLNDYDNSTAQLILRNTDFQRLEEQSTSYPAGTTIRTGTDDLRIGAGYGGDNYFDGYIDELRISNVVRDYSHQYNWETTSSDNFIFHYTKPELCTDNIILALENKFEDLDYTIYQVWDNIHLLDRSQKIEVFLYDTDEPFLDAPAYVRDWDVGYYLLAENELHIQVPSTGRQLKYFSNFEKATISVLARYVMAKKRPDGSVPSRGLSFGFGLYESGYSPDINLIQDYLIANSNTFPNKSTLDSWVELDEEINVEFAYTLVFASIFRFGYLMPTVYDGLYNSHKDIWYQIYRIFYLTDIEDGGMRNFYDGDDYIVYTYNQEVATLIVEGLQMYADQFEEAYGARIDHPLLVTIFSSDEIYTYTRRGNIDEIEGGGEAISHSLLRAGPPYTDPDLDPELNRLLVKYFSLMGHEFMHNVFAFLAETNPPSWLNEGAAMYAEIFNLQGYNDINVSDFDDFHNFFWNDNNMYLPDLDKIFNLDGNFGYKMGYSAFGFIKEHFSKGTLLQFMKTPEDFSIIDYNGIDEFKKHLYETLYHQYMPTFLFNPNWNVETIFTPGTTFQFSWNGHYIDDLIIEYSTDGMDSWNHITEVSFSSDSYSWVIPDADNCVLRFSDKKYPEINFPFQILGTKPTVDKVLNLTFDNGAVNNIPGGNNGRLKGDVSFESRDGLNGSYAKFDGVWDVLSVQNYQNLSLSENWTIQGDFMIENTTGVMNDKPVLLEKHSTDHSSKNYSISFNDNGQNHLKFEYTLENNTIVSLEVDDAGISLGKWYTYYFARSVENNIVEVRVYDQVGNILGNDIRQISGEGKVLTGSGDLFFGVGSFFDGKYLQGGLDNIIISDTYHDELMSNIIIHAPELSTAIDDVEMLVGGDAFVQDLSTVFTDADGDELSYSATSSDEAVATVMVENKILTVTAMGAGNATITVAANDGRGGTAEETFEVTVGVNTAPELSTAIGDVEMLVGGDAHVQDLSTVFTDADSDPLSYSATSSDEAVVTVAVENKSLTITALGAGNATITVAANDGRGGTAEETFEVTVGVNIAPELTTAIDDVDMLVGGDAFVQDLGTVFTDADGDALSYSATSSDEAVATVTVENNTVTVMSLAVGTSTITITADDGHGGITSISFAVHVLSGVAVERVGETIPLDYTMEQNYPNPFNPITTIRFALPEAGHVTLRMYNALGKEIETLTNEFLSPGRYSVSWDASGYASGVYLYRIESDNYVESKALTVLK